MKKVVRLPLCRIIMFHFYIKKVLQSKKSNLDRQRDILMRSTQSDETLTPYLSYCNTSYDLCKKRISSFDIYTPAQMTQLQFYANKYLKGESSNMLMQFHSNAHSTNFYCSHVDTLLNNVRTWCTKIRFLLKQIQCVILALFS